VDSVPKGVQQPVHRDIYSAVYRGKLLKTSIGPFPFRVAENYALSRRLASARILSEARSSEIIRPVSDEDEGLGEDEPKARPCALRRPGMEARWPDWRLQGSTVGSVQRNRNGEIVQGGVVRAPTRVQSLFGDGAIVRGPTRGRGVPGACGACRRFAGEESCFFSEPSRDRTD